jgi:two-component system sensor histidine kinase KdpD
MPTAGDEPGRRDPDEILAEIKRSESSGRGRLKVFLGFAAGVGKTFEMLNEANRRRARGQDVVIGVVETHGRQGTAEQLGDLEVIPCKQIEYRGTTVREMNLDAIIERHPASVLIDELAHTNAPGCAHDKRWKDVERLLDLGINVLTTMNVQHLESLTDTIHAATGIWVRETVPDRILHDADEVQLVDITPRALINRLERGDIYPRDRVEAALENWFHEGNLNALREIALREVAQEVDDDVEATRPKRAKIANWTATDRVMVCVSTDIGSMRLIRRGWRISQRLKAEVAVVYVEQKKVTSEQQLILNNHFELAERLSIPVVKLQGDIAAEVIRYAHDNKITHIVLGHSDKTRLQEMLFGSVVSRLVRELRSVDILLVAPSYDDEII